MKTLLFFTLLVCAVSADVSCLTIAWWSPIGGLICYLIPEQFNEAETAVAQQINTTVHQAKNAADFTLHNNPFTLGYDYLSTANSQGLHAANTQFEQKARNISQVTLGFAKESVSQALTIVELASFGMIVECIEFQAVQQGISAAYQAAGGQGISSTPSDGTNIATTSTDSTVTTSPPLSSIAPTEKRYPTSVQLASFVNSTSVYLNRRQWAIGPNSKRAANIPLLWDQSKTIDAISD